MKTFRSILIVFSFMFFGLGAMMFNFLVFPPAKILLKNDNDYKKFASKTIRKLWLFFLNFMILIRLIKLEIEDKEALKSIKNKVIVATHPSFIDIVILIALIPESTCYAKSTFAKNPLMGRMVKSLFIMNDLPLEEMQKQTKSMLDLGFNVIIFPMGIRHRQNEFPKIKKGASLIATNSNKNIVPIKLTADGDFLFINQPFYEGGNRTITFKIKVENEIVTNSFYDENEILYKKNVTKEIEKVLYH